MVIDIIDTFPHFKKEFNDNLDLSIENKLQLWEQKYMDKYPELQNKCKSDYEDNGYSWRKIAMTMVFNRTKQDFSKMIQAHNNILCVMNGINEKVKSIFNIELDLNVVLYCGLCNSAGWVTTYDGKRAILYGIDKIAELNWHTIEKIEPLIAHELCHVVHFHIRGEDDLSSSIEQNNYNRGIWQIYEEGFAQFYQQKLLGKKIDSRGQEWYRVCTENIEELKKLYLDALLNGEKGTKEFFGDWFKVMGISDAGYYLGAEFIKELNKELDVKNIATLSFEKIEEKVIEFLK